ncbi:MAG: sensor signal transduction histidine kinase [Acidimicrobiales bacterium]|nr:sensor signal transduction histidine kinase [Acidimicrobiales bacterium]
MTDEAAGSAASVGPLGHVVIDAERRIVEADATAEAALGTPRDELLGRRIDELVGDDGMAVVSTVSHELRSPLTSIKGYTSLLLNRWDRLGDDDKRMMLQQVNHDADRVTRLVTELLDISRLQTGRLTLHCQDVDLAGLAASVVEKVRMGHPDLDAALSFPADLPVADADPDKIEQVLTNLLENAVKYASPVGLRVEGSLAGDQVRVAVVDRGDGIDPGDLERIFEKFFQHRDGRPTGTGLGLWISRGLVEAHGGALTAESSSGVGSTFAFTLPLAPPTVLA